MSSDIGKTMIMESRRVEAGIFYALISLASPLLIPLWLMIAQEFPETITSRVASMVAVVLVIVIIVIWAAGIVSCVSDIARVYSQASRYGLFILLISPFFWLAFLLIRFLNEFNKYLDALTIF